MEAVKDYAAGMAAGIATVITGHPFDTVKVKLQTQSALSGHRQYKGALDCSAHILRTEGVRGLYKGATPSFVGMAMESSVLFGVYSQAKKALQGAGVPSAAATSLGAATGGACVALILCPSELVKCRLQVQAHGAGGGVAAAPAFAGPVDCVVKTIRQDGLRGMYRGLSPTLLRESLGNVFFFGTYEATRAALLAAAGVKSDRGGGLDGPVEEGEGPAEAAAPRTAREVAVEAGAAIMSGGLAGVVFWAAVLPLDVAKTRMQTASGAAAGHGLQHHLVALYREGGLRALYAGLTPTLTRAFPANAAAIVTWEVTMRLLSWNAAPAH